MKPVFAKLFAATFALLALAMALFMTLDLDKESNTSQNIPDFDIPDAPQLNVSDLVKSAKADLDLFKVSLQENKDAISNSTSIFSKVNTNAKEAELSANFAWNISDDYSAVPSIPLKEDITESAIITVPPAYKMDLKVGDKVNMPLPDGSEVSVTIINTNHNIDGDLSWDGVIDDSNGDYFITYTAGKRASFATLVLEQGNYSMESVDGIGWLYKNIQTTLVDDYIIPDISKL
jgi:hypothetical protein